MAYTLWLAIVIGLAVSRVFIVGEIDNSPSSLYKDAAHLLFGGAFVYACFVTRDALRGDVNYWGVRQWTEVAMMPPAVLWIWLVVSVVVEIAVALRDNF